MKKQTTTIVVRIELTDDETAAIKRDVIEIYGDERTVTWREWVAVIAQVAAREHVKKIAERTADSQ